MTYPLGFAYAVRRSPLASMILLVILTTIPGPASAQVSLTCDTVEQATIAGTETDSYEMTVSNGEKVTITIIEESKSAFALEFRVLTANLAPEATCGTWLQTRARDCGPLTAADGPYIIEVRDRLQDQTGTYEVHYQTLNDGLACDAVALACDTPYVGTLDSKSDNDLLSFTVTDNETVYLDVGEGAGVGPLGVVWRVIDKNGNAPPDCVNYQTFPADCGPLPASGNPYRIQVHDSSYDATGEYIAYLQRLDSTLACEATAITCDDNLSSTLEEKPETDMFRFTASDGELVTIAAAVTPPKSAYRLQFRVLKADGTPEASCGTWFPAASRDCGPLSAADSPYQIQVREENQDVKGDFTIHLQRLPSAFACDTPIACDTPTAGSINAFADNDLLSFNVVQDEIVYIDVQETSVNFLTGWRVIDKDGLPAADCGNYSSNPRDCGPLPPSGNPYRIQVREFSLSRTGSYSAHLQRITSSSACETLALACDTSVNETFESRAETDLYRFTANDGELTNIAVAETPDASAYLLQWRVLNADGTAETTCGSWSTLGARDCGALSATDGPFQVQVRELNQDKMGNYVIHRQTLSSSFACNQPPFPCDTTFSGTLDSAADTELLSFDVVDDERLYIMVQSVAGFTFSAAWRVLDGDGNPAVSCGSYAVGPRDCGPLPASGSPYRVQIRETQRDEPGDYIAHLQRLDSGQACEALALACDQSIGEAINGFPETDLYAISAQNGESFTVAMNETPQISAFSLEWRILNGDGTEATNNCGSWSTSEWRDCGPLPIGGAPYRVHVRDNAQDRAGAYDIHLQSLPFSLSCDATPISCDVPYVGTLDSESDDDLLEFNVAQDEYVYAIVSPITLGSFGVTWRLLDRNGDPASPCNGYQAGSRNCGPLPASGNPYRMQIRESNLDDTGTYLAEIQQLSLAEACDVTPLTCDTTVPGVLDANSDSDLFTFVASQGDNVTIQVEETTSTSAYAVEWRVLAADGTAASACGGWSPTNFRSCGPMQASEGPFRVQVRDALHDRTGEFEVSLGSCCTLLDLELVASDVSNDGGGSVRVDWAAYFPPPATIGFDVLRSDDPCVLAQGGGDLVGSVGPTATELIDATAVDYTTYYYKLKVMGVAAVLDELTSNSVFSFPNLVINEFAPAGGVAPKSGYGKIGELVEIQNLASVSVDLTGWVLSNGAGAPTPDDEPITGLIPAGGLFVHTLVTIDLPDAGGTLALIPPGGSEFAVDVVNYGTEGGAPAVPPGFTIQRVAGSTGEDPDSGSFETGEPSPGAPNNVATPNLGGSILINEVYYEGGPGEDYVEIVNPLGTTLVLDQFQIADGSGFLDTLPSGVELGPGELFVLDASSAIPFTRDLTNTTLYLYQLTETSLSQRIDQIGWGAASTDPAPPTPSSPNDALVRSPDGTPAYLGDQGANWLDSGGGVSMFYGPPSPGTANLTETSVVFSVDPLGGGDFTTISDALSFSIGGVIVLVAPGTYHESITLVDGVELVGQATSSQPVILAGDGINPAITGNGVGNFTQLRSLLIRSVAGGMNLTNASPQLTNVWFESNVTLGDGAAVWIDGGAPSFDGCVFMDNVSQGNGGAVSVISGLPSFTFCLFVGNEANGIGGALHQIDGTTDFSNCVFDQNGTYQNNGGSIHALGGDVSAVYSTLTNGKAGAALRAEGAGSVDFSCGLLNNHPKETPGGDSVFLADVIEGQDPQFCQPLALNYSHSATSPLSGLEGTCGTPTIGVAGPPCGVILTATAPTPRATPSQLHPPVPNPFNPATELRFELGRSGMVRLDVYDVRGRRVASPVVDKWLDAGLHQVAWRGLDNRNRPVASGVYFARLKLDGAVVGRVQQMVLLK